MRHFPQTVTFACAAFLALSGFQSLRAQIAAPQFSPPGGNFVTQLNVTVSESTPGTTVHYTVTGVNPTVNDPIVDAGSTLLMPQTCTLIAQATDGNGNFSPLTSATYNITGMIAGGGVHALGVTTTGAFLAWGNQAQGRLGNGTTATGSIPVPAVVAGTSAPFNGPVASASAGYAHSLLLDGNQNVWAFGDDGYGELGNNSTTDSGVPVHVLENVSPTTYLSGIIQVEAGNSFSLAVDSGGTVWAWGSQSDGRLGNGSTSTTTYQKWATPVLSASPGMLGVTQVAAGQQFAMALDGQHQVWTWGSNSNGQLGNGTTTSTSSAIQAKLNSTSSNLPNVVAVAAGYNHAVALRNTSPGVNTVWTWGNRGSCRLGDNGATSGNATYPVEVVNSVGSPLQNIMQISCGFAHTLALDSNGNVWAWGLNSDGNLGDGTTTDRNYAVEVLSNADIVSIAGGGYDDGTNYHSFSLAVSATGQVYAWGYQGYGELGDNSTSTTVLVKTPTLQSSHFDPGWFSPEGYATFSSFTAQNIVGYAPGSVNLAFQTSEVGPLGINFYANGNYIGNSPASSSGAFSWSGVAPGDYQIVAEAFDATGASSSAQFSMSFLQPQVTALGGAGVYIAPANFTLAATLQGTPNHVNFFNNGSLLGSASAPPWQLSVQNLPTGNYTMTADAVYGSTASAPATATVTVKQAVLTGLASVQTYSQNLTLAATYEGSPSEITYSADGTVLETVTQLPFTFAWKNIAIGTHSITASAPDGLGGTTQQSATVTVLAPVLSGVASGEYVIPAGDTTLPSLVLTPNYQGNLQWVTYTANGVQIGTATQAPYQLTWTNVPAGTYQITALAPVGSGGITTVTATEVVFSNQPVRFTRGSGDVSCLSSIIALDQQQGIALESTGGNSDKFPGGTPWFLETSLIQPAFQLQMTQVNGVLTFGGYPSSLEFTNPNAAFGALAGGSALYTGQSYSFGVVAGGQESSSSFSCNLMISVFDLSSFSGEAANVEPIGQYQVPLPQPGTAAWDAFAANGYVQQSDLSTYTYKGTPISFKTSIQYVPGGLSSEQWGQSADYPLLITHSCGRSDLGFVISYCGATDDAANNPYWLATTNPALAWQNPAYSLSYSLDFTVMPPWQSSYLTQPQFSGTPLPSFYQGATVDELVHDAPPVSFNIPAPGGQYLDLDDSPELRRHPILDQFVSDMAADPVALTNYVLNQIDLTDAMAYNGTGTSALSSVAINPGGVNRSALAVLQEGQGSPVEQCALLVYLLRQAGYPAAYVFGAANGLEMFDEQLSKLLHMQLHGAVDDLGNPEEPQTSGPTLIPVNYPWVATYINGQWIHIFPWLKDTAIEEGLDLSDYLPTVSVTQPGFGYTTGLQWLEHYLLDDPGIRGLSTEYDNPGYLFPKFVTTNLAANYPNVSIDDLGVTIYNRQDYFPDLTTVPRPWQTPFVNSSNLVDTLSSSNAPANIFDQVDLQVYSDRNNDGAYESSTDGPMLDTGWLNACDLHNRRLLLYHVQTQPGATTYNMVLSLEPYSTAYTGTFNFNNATSGVVILPGSVSDGTLLNQQTLSQPLSTADDNLQFQVTYKRHRSLDGVYDYASPDHWTSFLGFSEDTSVVDSRPLRKGDLAALCLNFGRVTHTMLSTQANKYWLAQQQQLANPNGAVNIETAYGLPAYLMGMSYYCNVGAFEDTVSSLTKSNPISFYAHGFAKLTPLRDATGALLNNQITLKYPRVDMSFYRMAWASNSTLHPDSGDEDILPGEDWAALLIGETSAQEHRVINQFFKQSTAVSTVKLLDLAQAGTPGANVIELSSDAAAQSYWGNYSDQATTLLKYQGKTIEDWAGGTNTGSIWNAIVTYLNEPTSTGLAWSNVFNRVLITPGPQNGAKDPVTGNYDYSGMGAFLMGPNSFAALIDQENGGDGPAFSGSDIDYDSNANLTSPSDFTGNQLFLNEDGSLSMQGTNFTSSQQPFSQAVSLQSIQSVVSSLNAGTTAFGPEDLLSQIILIGLSGENWIAQYDTGIMAIATASNLAAGGNDSATPGNGTDSFRNLDSFVQDPVNSITGEFYIDALDLKLNGPMPLEIRRNYGSFTLSDGNYGYGWRLAYLPYLAVSGDSTLIYATETDGTTVAYRQQAYPFQWVYIPATGDNPLLQATTSEDFSPSHNLFGNSITTDGAGNYTLTGADGSVRTFATQSYPLPGISRSRPYLQKWTDNRGNYYTFTFGSDNTQVDYGQLTRITSSNGDYLGFVYDASGHIDQAFTGDGRRLTYTYDNYGDLVQVQLPDASSISYIYQHPSQTVGGVQSYYSTHLITEEDKPEGRVVQNTYDATRRVSTQSSTVGTNKIPIQNASFTYYNALSGGYTVNPNANSDGTITGYTVITDVNQNQTTYYYTNSQLTGTLDATGQKTSQVWNGRSIASRTDERGLLTQYQYSSGTVQKTVTGDLGASQNTATTTYLYNSLNSVTQVTDPAGIVTALQYQDTLHPYQPTSVTRSTAAGAISTTLFTYEDVSAGANSAHGLVKTITQASGTNDQSVMTFTNLATGYPASSSAATGTGDPAVVLNYTYNLRGELISQQDAAGRKTTYAYDGCGRRTAKQRYDQNGNLVWWEFYYYNQNGEISWIDGPRYNPEDYICYQYDGAGRRSQEIKWRSQANPNGSGVQAIPGTDAAYSTTFYQHDAFGNLIEVDDPNYNAVTMIYDAIGQLEQRDYHEGDASTAIIRREIQYYSYNQAALQVQYVDPLNGTTTKTFTQSGLLESQSNPDGTSLSWAYDLDGRLVTETLSNGDYWSTSYDDFNRTVTRTFHPVANEGVPSCQEVKIYDRRGNVISKTDLDGNTSTATYDGLNRIKTASGPAATATTAQHEYVYTYDAAGVTTVVLDSTGLTSTSTTITHDAVDRPTSITIEGGQTRQISFSYSADGNSVTRTVGAGATAVSTTTYTNTIGQPVLTLNGDGTFRMNSYDPAGNLLTSDDEHGDTTTYTYDSLNRLAYKMLPSDTGAPATVTYGWNAAGELTSMGRLDENNQPGAYYSASYDYAGRKTSEKTVGSDGVTDMASSTFAYYRFGPNYGKLESVTDQRGVVSTTTYDDFFRPRTLTTTGPTGAQGQSVAYSYNNRGLATSAALSFTDGVSGPAVTVNRTYDGYGNVTDEQTLFNGTISSEFAQTWDAAGRRSSLSFVPTPQGSGTGSYSFSYQDVGPNITQVSIDGHNYGFSYNTAGLVAARTNPSRTWSVSQWDPQGRILSESDSVNSTTPLSETQTWRPDAKLASYSADRTGTGVWNETRPYVTYSGSQEIVPNSYNRRGQLIEEPFAPASGQTAALGYEFDLDAEGESGPGVRTQAVYTSQDYESVNTNGVNPLNQVLAETNLPGAGASQAISWSYDGNGEVATRSVASGVTQTLTWDAFGRLIKLQQRDPSNNGFDWFADYDAFGRRVRTVQQPVSGGTETGAPLTTDSFYDPQVEFLELGVAVNTTSAVTGANPAPRTWKVYGPDLNGTYGGLQGTGGLEATIDETSGTVTGIISDAFGNTVATSNGTSVTWNAAEVGGYGLLPGTTPNYLDGSHTLAQATVWRGHRLDPTGYYYLGARYYDPLSGRFLSPDPLGYATSLSLYDFASNDPVNHFDPTGRFGVNPTSSSGGNANGANDPFDPHSPGSFFSPPSDPFAPATAQTTIDLLGAEGGQEIMTQLSEQLQYNALSPTMKQVSRWSEALANVAPIFLAMPEMELVDGAIMAGEVEGTMELGFEGAAEASSEEAFVEGTGSMTESGFVSAAETGGGEGWKAQDFLEEVAARAESKIGGTGALAGTAKHAYAAELIDRFQSLYGPVGGGLSTEQSYLGGVWLGRSINVANSVRLDVVEGAVTSPSAVFDFKFTINPNPTLSPARILQIQTEAGLAPGVPITVIHP